MSISRREFLRMMGFAGAAGMMPSSVFAAAKQPADLYEVPKFGNVSLLHITDTHAQLNPIYFREPNVNLGIGYAFNKAPHLVGDNLLKHFGVTPGTIESHAFSYLDFDSAAGKFGKVGGFAHLKTLVQQIRDDRGPGNSLLMDGGDTWQGSGTAYWTRGQDMVGACNRLGVDVMTGHWEFTYLDKEVIDNVNAFKGDFVAQNVLVRDEALFDYNFADFEGFDEDSGNAFKPYVMKQVGGARVAVIGQAFPYTPIANPQRFIPDWTFGIQDDLMQGVVDMVRENEKPDVVVVLSHNGMDVDLKMASRVSGIDVIFGGHTHDGMPAPTVVKNSGGKTLVTNAGSNGKFLGVMDLDVKGGKVRDFRYRLLPVFSNMLPADKAMQAYIDEVRAPYAKQLNEELAVAEETLYRRGNFNGTFDQVICDALTTVNDAQISLSPGFRWGTSVLPGQKITMDNVMDQTCITYPETYRREMKGSEIKAILEDVCDNLFNKDPYYQQGGDMVRVGGLDYVCEPGAGFGKRITDMALNDGTKVEANKSYTVSGWATVGSKAPGEPIWDVVAKYLRDQKTVKINKLNTPKLVGVKDNPGLADYPY
ncbi:MAG: thiosulfohydrolase SoxB [Candidatus Thiodiazotropha weberae]|uniref:Thiosulfohydrolase SoxB n=1 Tax=Candidatus Thiodiazotropha endoloripes TaxID=1818881 RepID=A0A1E2UIS5_9GAMM|nr:thiosulfohydrolase SoxB [Candidatus Thiodiazotropha endoloripes]MCG7898982.1 thiosulfohydrolase SoxB [Candidatus Thiodiazotropha weberae]MCG7901759.1 thiosulfohydrolase SoxB [Candidatus Thiodiazotropha weberae]MCG7912372.1 thiosulfohydrolase SoxB [Candidatus Thiodiazotropha weberae]ODB83494.1 thiosulfohydrolase SoxB [Candidatus Thiodiazotropha endoloripes]ODB90926.1 thiosulfohydrolase SoxB [Candidatus Thiodiazotropha endoloripes]